MELNCINPKTYALTQNQLYTILDQDGNYVFVINDKGKTSKYHRSLFEEQAPARTEQDCINSITYTNNNLSYIDINNTPVSFGVSLTANSNNSFSCGVVRIENINNLCEQINVNVDTSQDDFLELRKALFTKVFNTKIGGQTSQGMWMCSTNQIDDYEDYQLLLDSLATHNSGWFRNPNSGNQIKVWYGIMNQ